MQKKYRLHRVDLNENEILREMVETSISTIQTISNEFFTPTLRAIVNIGQNASKLALHIAKFTFDRTKVFEKMKLKIDSKTIHEIEEFEMYLNRKPEIELVKLVNDLDIQLYGKIDRFRNNEEYKNKLAKNTLNDVYLLPSNENNEEIEYETIPFKLLSKIINGDNTSTDTEILKKEFSKNLDNLFNIYLTNKNRNNDVSVEVMINEVLKYGFVREIAINDPMVYGKDLKSLFDNKMETIEKLTPEQQMNLISNLMKPADGKSLYRQVINQLSEDFIRQVGDNYQLDEDENGSFIIRGALEKAIGSDIRHTGHALLFEDINHLDFKHFPKENILFSRLHIPQVVDDITKFQENIIKYNSIPVERRSCGGIRRKRNVNECKQKKRL